MGVVLAEIESVPEGDGDRVGPKCVPEAERECVAEPPVGLAVPDRDIEVLPERVWPGARGVGEAPGVRVVLAQRLPVCEGETVGEVLLEAQAEAQEEAVSDRVAVAHRVAEPEGLKVALEEAQGVAWSELLGRREPEVLGEGEGEGVARGDCDAEGQRERVGRGEALRAPLWVYEALLHALMEMEGLSEAPEEPLGAGVADAQG